MKEGMTVSISVTEKKGNNILFILALIIYIVILSFSSVDNAQRTIIFTGVLLFFCIFWSLRLLLKHKNILDPIVWFPPFFGIANLMTCFFVYSNFPLSWYEPYRDTFTIYLKDYLLIVSVALLAFYCGNSARFRYREKNVLTLDINNSEYTILIKRLLFLLIICVCLFYISVLTSGGLKSMAQQRGVDQFSYYGGIQYLLNVIMRLLYYSAIAALLPLLFMKKKNTKNFLILFIIMGIFLIPIAYIGTRNYTVFFILLLLISKYTIQESSKNVISVKNIFLGIISGIILIIFLGVIRGVEGDSLGMYFLHFFSEMNYTSSLGLTTMSFFPDQHNYFYGWTYPSAFFNLIPNIFFGGNRPFVNPSLTYHELFASNLTDIGFGFSILAEAYMNGGIVAVFIFFLFFSMFLSHIFLKPNKTAIDWAMVSIVFVSTLWYIRSDSTSYVKQILFSYIIFRIVYWGIGMRKYIHTKA